LARKAPLPDLEPWQKDEPVPRGFWADKANQKRYLDWLGAKLGISKREDWYFFLK